MDVISLINRPGYEHSRSSRFANALYQLGHNITSYGVSNKNLYPTIKVVDCVTYKTLPLNKCRANLFWWVPNSEFTSSLKLQLAKLHCKKIQPYIKNNRLAKCNKTPRKNKIITIKKIIKELLSKFRISNSSSALFWSYYKSFIPYVIQEKNIDLIVVHELCMLEIGIAISKLYNAKCVYDSLELESYRNTNINGREKRLRLKNEEYFIKFVDICTFTTEGHKKIFTKIYQNFKGTTEIVHNSNIENRINKKTKTTIREVVKNNGLKADKIILYTGLVSSGRGISQIINSLRLIPDNYCFVILGYFACGYRDSTIQLAKKNGVEKRVIIIDPIPADDVIPFINSADVAVIPFENTCLSYYYGLPNKAFESAFAGLPIVASNLPDLSDFVTNNRIGITINIDSPEDFSQAIINASLSRKKYYKNDKELHLIKKYCLLKSVRKTIASIESNGTAK